jgi:hypothetical protein
MRATSSAAILHRDHRGTEDTEENQKVKRPVHVFATSD